MSKFVELDGVKNGIAVYLYGNEDFLKGNAIRDEETRKFIIHPDKNKLFKNVESARAFLFSRFNITNPCDYKFYFFLEDGIQIDFDNAEYFPECGYYEYYHNSGECYFIKEENINRVTSIGYFTFADIYPDTTGNTISAKYKEYIKNAINEIVKYPDSFPTISKISIDKNGHLVAYVKGTTIQIHILTNSQIMDLNTKRKEYGMRCIPYLKEMDKFKTIYCYITKDNNDFSDNTINQKIDKVIEIIVEVINNHNPEIACSFIPVEFKGVITDQYKK